MKYLRRFNEDVSDYKDTSSVLKEFNTKRGILESIFRSKSISDSEIESQILSKVFDGEDGNQNPLLSRYSTILKIKRHIDLIEEESSGDQKRMDQLKKDISDLKSRSISYPESVDYYETEISKAKGSILEIESRVSERSKKISEIQSKLDKEESEFKDMVNEFSKSG